MNSFKQYLTEKYSWIYHGDNYGTTKLDPKLMDNGNNEEGIGIYFSDDISVAESYGKFVSKIPVQKSSLVNSRGLVKKELLPFGIFRLLKYLNEKDNESMYYLITDWIEIYEPKDITEEHLKTLSHKMGGDEVRNFQITLSQSFGVELFVKAWNEIFRKIYGTYNKDRGFYCIINTSLKMQKVNF